MVCRRCSLNTQHVKPLKWVSYSVRRPISQKNKSNKYLIKYLVSVYSMSHKNIQSASTHRNSRLFAIWSVGMLHIHSLKAYLTLPYRYVRYKHSYFDLMQWDKALRSWMGFKKCRTILLRLPSLLVEPKASSAKENNERECQFQHLSGEGEVGRVGRIGANKWRRRFSRGAFFALSRH